MDGLENALLQVGEGYSVQGAGLVPIMAFYVGRCVQSLFMVLPVLRDVGMARQHWQRQWKYALLVGAVSPVSYVMVLYALQIAPLSHVAPAREVSMLFAALLGGHLLGEGDRLARLCGAACICSGVAALALG